MTHEYLSTSCWHGEHDRCAAPWGVDTMGWQFAKEPGVCKFCREPCRCDCHLQAQQ